MSQPNINDHKESKVLKDLIETQIEDLFRKCKFSSRVYYKGIPIWSSRKEELVFFKIANNANIFKTFSIERENLGFRIVLEAQAAMKIDSAEIILERKGKVIYSRKKGFPILKVVKGDRIEIDFPFKLIMEGL